MPTYSLKADLLLLVTALIWGVAFVAQRAGMNYIGPFTFNTIRFAMGILVLLPFIFKGNVNNFAGQRTFHQPTSRLVFWGQITLGIILFCAASLQQVGLVYTTAGKAGFITGLYVVIVPILGMFLKQQTHLGTWLGAILAAAGLYLLSVTENFTFVYGDFLILIGALLWAVHVHLIGWLALKTDSTVLAIIQYLTCSILSFLMAFLFETITFKGIWQAAVPILYGGLLSVGVAYTLQVVAQKEAHPAHAAILLSLESVFAAIGGWLLLNEVLSFRGFIGCCLMLGGMLISQLYRFIIQLVLSQRL
ncbi:MAG: DMT family transporter [Desulfobacteraceae bacterium]|jgi:drug/metabolite transporter (DMT)-like permease